MEINKDHLQYIKSKLMEKGVLVGENIIEEILIIDGEYLDYIVSRWEE